MKEVGKTAGTIVYVLKVYADMLSSSSSTSSLSSSPTSSKLYTRSIVILKTKQRSVKRRQIYRRNNELNFNRKIARLEVHYKLDKLRGTVRVRTYLYTCVIDEINFIRKKLFWLVFVS